MVTERFIIITVLSVSFNDMAQIRLSIVDILHDLDFCVVVTQHPYIERQ